MVRHFSDFADGYAILLENCRPDNPPENDDIDAGALDRALHKKLFQALGVAYLRACFAFIAAISVW